MISRKKLDDQTAGFAFWDTARHQVVHLLVIKTAHSSSVASPGDFTGFDFKLQELRQRAEHRRSATGWLVTS